MEYLEKKTKKKLYKKMFHVKQILLQIFFSFRWNSSRYTQRGDFFIHSVV